jgi:uncharacterized membrane protein
MMGTKAEAFLKEFAKHLQELAHEERDDIIKEIKSHIQTGLQHGQSEEEILKRLGSPKSLAKGYLGEYYLQQKSSNPSHFFKLFFFFASLGFLSPVVIVFLAGVSFAFAIGAVAVLISGILSTFEYSIGDFTFGVQLGSQTITGWPGLLISLVVAVILWIGSKWCWRGLRQYFAYLASKYRRLIKKENLHA